MPRHCLYVEDCVGGRGFPARDCLHVSEKFPESVLTLCSVLIGNQGSLSWVFPSPWTFFCADRMTVSHIPRLGPLIIPPFIESWFSEVSWPDKKKFSPPLLPVCPPSNIR